MSSIPRTSASSSPLAASGNLGVAGTVGQRRRPRRRFVALGGLVTQRARRWDISWVFLAAWAALVSARVLWLGQPWTIFTTSSRTAALLLFAFFMISDPMTIPNRRSAAHRLRDRRRAPRVRLAIRAVPHQRAPVGAFFRLAAGAADRPRWPGDAFSWRRPGRGIRRDLRPMVEHSPVTATRRRSRAPRRRPESCCTTTSMLPRPTPRRTRRQRAAPRRHRADRRVDQRIRQDRGERQIQPMATRRIVGEHPRHRPQRPLDVAQPHACVRREHLKHPSRAAQRRAARQAHRSPRTPGSRVSSHERHRSVSRERRRACPRSGRARRRGRRTRPGPAD